MARLILIFFLIATINGTFWMNKEFGEVYPYEFFFHLFYGVGNLATINETHYHSFFTHIVINPIIASIFIAVVLNILNHAKLQSTVVIKLFNITQFLFSKKNLLAIYLLAFIYLLYSINIHLLFSRDSEKDFFETHYTQPNLKDIIAPEVKKNLILIYVESLSAEYENIKRYPENPLKDLKIKTQNNYSLNFKQGLTNRWTQAGLFDSMCGLPLKISFGRRFRDNPRLTRWNEKAQLFFKAQKSHPDFAPKIVCLGNVLRDHGYQNIFMGGADLNFSGKGQFLKQHGYHHTFGKAYWESIAEDRFNDWGLPDDRLFFHAKNKILELHQSEQPFNFTMLTLNLHEPEGYTDQTCTSRGYTNYLGLVKCTNEYLSNFIDFYYEHKLHHDTDLVIVGDHNPRNNISLLDGQETDQSLIFNRFISQTKLNINRESTYHFGLYPSILHMLGFNFPNNKLGLEGSFFGEDHTPPSAKVSNLRPHELLTLINNYSLFYSKLMYSNEE